MNKFPDRYSCIQKCLRKSGTRGAHLGGEGESPFYVSTYCNYAHRKSDGKPIAHECRIIPPEALRAEMEGDYERSIEILKRTPAKMMRRGVKQFKDLGLPYHRDDVGRPSAVELRAMPTLSVSQADDLKIDTGETRVWLARTGVADGEPYNNKVTIERLVKGHWEVEATYPGVSLRGAMAGLPGGSGVFYTSAPQHGFFVTRQSPDVAFFHWVATAEEAEQIAAKLSVRENAHYDVIPARPIGSSSLKGSGFPRQPDWEAPIDQEPEYEEPDEGDWITSDHRNFYSYGKRVLEVDDDTATDHKRLWAAIDATMKRQNFYPNVWFISDHGNWHLMTRDR